MTSRRSPSKLRDAGRALSGVTVTPRLTDVLLLARVGERGGAGVDLLVRAPRNERDSRPPLERADEEQQRRHDDAASTAAAEMYAAAAGEPNSSCMTHDRRKQRAVRPVTPGTPMPGVNSSMRQQQHAGLRGR